MAFFDRLQSETEQARAHVTGAPVIQAIREGRFDLEGYTWFLIQAYHHVKHTVPLMMACGGRLPERLEFLDEFPVSSFGKVSKKDLVAMITRKLEEECA